MESLGSEPNSHKTPGLEHYWLRTILPEDAGEVLRLRTNATRTRYLHTVDTSLKGQELWIARDLNDVSTRYFAIMHDDKVEGLIGLTCIDVEQRTSEWGRWIVDEGSMAAVPSVVLIYDYCFSVLNLVKVYCRTVISNAEVLSFHKSCGLAEGPVLKDWFVINDAHCDAVEHFLEREEWDKHRGDLLRRARRIDRPV